MKTFTSLLSPLMLLLFVFNYNSVTGQTSKDTTIYLTVEQSPSFPGGNKAMFHYIYSNLNYPDSAAKNNVQGKVYLKIVVEPDGSLSNIQVLKGIGYGCDKEAVRIISSMPKWEPGMINGKKVRAYFSVMVMFKLKTGADNNIYSKVDSLPVFDVGAMGMTYFIQSKLRFPVNIIKDSIIDTVNVVFVVGKDKSIYDVGLMKPKDTLNAYDYEAMRVVKALPVSEPAILNSKKVNMRLFIPVIFNYQNIDTSYAIREQQIYDGNMFYYYSFHDTTVFQVVEQMPSFPGGRDALMTYLATNTRYPQEAKKKFKSGKVYMQFIVETDGSISHVKVLRGVCKSLDAEAVRVIKKMPRWTPGYQKGKPIRVVFNIPIKFTMSF